MASTSSGVGSVTSVAVAHQFDSIHQAIPAIIGDLHGIGMDERNEAQGYAFRSIDAIKAALRPLLGKHGVYYHPNTREIRFEQRTTRGGGTLWTTILHLEVTFTARDGSAVVADAWSEGTDMADKATSKAYTGALKTILQHVFDIAGDGKDGDPDSGGVESDPVAQTDWFVENGWRDAAQHDEWRGTLVVRVRAMTPKVREAWGLWKHAEAIDLTKAVTRAQAKVIQDWLEEFDVKDPPAPAGAADPTGPGECAHLDTDVDEAEGGSGVRFCVACGTAV